MYILTSVLENNFNIIPRKAELHFDLNLRCLVTKEKYSELNIEVRRRFGWKKRY
jgi:hypothetical protein